MFGGAIFEVKGHSRLNFEVRPQIFLTLSESLAANLEKVRQTSV